MVAHLGLKLFSVLLTEGQSHLRLRKPMASVCERTVTGSPRYTTGWCWGSGVCWWSGRGTGVQEGLAGHFGGPLGQEQRGQVCATLCVQPCLSPAPTPYLSAT